MFNLAYFASAITTEGELSRTGFGNCMFQHVKDLPRNRSLLYRIWNKGNYTRLVMRGVVVFNHEFLLCRPLRTPLYHALESCATALLGGYHLVAAETKMQLEQMKLCPLYPGIASSSDLNDAITSYASVDGDVVSGVKGGLLNDIECHTRAIISSSVILKD